MIELKQKRDCCGCGACEQKCPQKCIVLKTDEEGFLYPSFDRHVCTRCGLCSQVCPGLNREPSRLPIQVYAAKNPDEQIRIASSSGGIFTMLAQQTLRQGGAVFGARFDNNWEVYHDYTVNEKGMAPFRGSKYVQSRIGNSYIQVEKFLKEGSEVLFSGTACQVAGLKRFLHRDYCNLLTVDVVCHGVPSPLVWKEYLRKSVSVPNNDAQHTTCTITNISFRNKSSGWKNFGLEISTGHSPTPFFETLDKNAYMQGFLNNIYLRPSCYACPVRCGKSGSDLTIGDYWGISRWEPDFDDDKGVGLVLVYSKKGAAAFSNLNVDAIQTTYNQALSGNIAIERNAALPGCRREFWQRFRSEGADAIGPMCRKLHPEIFSRGFSLAKKILKRMFGKV